MTAELRHSQIGNQLDISGLSLQVPFEGGTALVYDTTLCTSHGLIGPVKDVPISPHGITVGEAAQSFNAASFIDYVHSGSDMDPYSTTTSLGIGFAPHIRSRYLSLPLPDGGYAIAFNVPNIEPGMEEHMVGVALWAQFLKRLREERPEILTLTFYEGDSSWRTGTDPLLNVMATSFTTALVGEFSEIGDEKERKIVSEVHAHEVGAGMSEELIESLRLYIKERVTSAVRDGKPALQVVLDVHNQLTLDGYMDRRKSG
jgi:hypothetical protein